MSGSGYGHDEHIAAGLKASMHNPNVSDAAKDRSAQRLRDMGMSEETTTTSSSKKGPSNSSGPAFIDDTEQAESGDPGGDFIIEEEEEEIAAPDTSHQAQVHQHRVISGYKATLKNPRVSETAKAHAREQLDAMGASE